MTLYEAKQVALQIKARFGDESGVFKVRGRYYLVSILPPNSTPARPCVWTTKDEGQSA